MAITDLAIKIATTLDSTGLRQANKAVGGLSKSVSKLGRNLGLALGTTAFVAYSKAAVKAFAEDDKAAKVLGQTLNNLGLDFSNNGKTLNDYISKIEIQTGVLDDELRPAMDRLLRSTLDITKSQELLSLALDISAGTGKTVTQVSQSLQKAYLGQTQAIGRLGVGLSKTELTSSSFEQIQKRLAVLFKGQASIAADTYAGKIDQLTVASNNAKEVIGKGLVDALGAAGGGGGLAGSLEGIIKLATTVSDLFVGIGRTIAAVKPFFTPDVSPIEAFKQYQKITAAFRLEDQIARRQFGGAAAVKYQKEAAALAKKNAVANSKLIQNQTKVLSDEQKKQAALKKAGTVFDLEQIGIVAALQGKISKDDELRLKAQLALLNGNEVVATALTKQILMAQDQTGNLYKLFLALPDARNPFAYLEGYLDMLAGKAASILSTPAAVMSAPSASQPSKIIVGGTIIDLPTTNVQTGAFPRSQPGDFRRAEEASNMTGPIQVVVQIDGKAVASSLQNSSLSGIGSTVNRTGG